MSLTVAEWGKQVCALSVKAAAALDVPGVGSPEVLTLTARKERAAEVLAPRANALAAAAAELAAIQLPRAVQASSGTFANYHAVLQRTIADLATAWQALVNSAASARSAEEINAANVVLMRADDKADQTLDLVGNPYLVSGEMRKALAEPEDCGILNKHIGSCPDPKRCSGLRLPERAGA